MLSLSFGIQTSVNFSHIGDVIWSVPVIKLEDSFALGVKGKGKGKPKFSSHFQSHKEGTHCPSTSNAQNPVSRNIHKVPERLDTTELGSEGNLIAELLEDIQGDEENQFCIPPAEVEALRQHGHAEQSMAELLDGLQDKTSLLRRNFKMVRSLI